MIDISDIERLVKSEIDKKIQQALSQLDIDQTVGQLLTKLAEDKASATATSIVNNLIKEGKFNDLIQKTLTSKIDDKIDEAVKIKTSNSVSRTDIGNEISKQIKEFVENKMMKADLPDGLIPLKAIDRLGLSLSADDITPGTIKSFSSTGIQDIANSIELTIMDGMVVVENVLAAKELVIDSTAEFKSNVNIVGDLRLSGDLIFLNPKFHQQLGSMIEDKITKSKDSTIDIGSNAILSNGKDVINSSSLGASVIYSNLRKVGNLQDLNVIGKFSAAQTLSVDGTRVGINTDDPAGALTVWDEDAELTIRKHKSKTTFIGTSRDCDLVIGTNGSPAINIRRDGTVEFNKLLLGTLLISTSNDIPEYEGKLGEIVFMSNPKQDQPFAYQCAGGNSWLALKR